MDVLGGWVAGAALVSVIVSVHILGVDERLRVAAQRAGPAQPVDPVATSAAADVPRRVAVPLRHREDDA
jgi:hypothetical protein